MEEEVKHGEILKTDPSKSLKRRLATSSEPDEELSQQQPMAGIRSPFQPPQSDQFEAREAWKRQDTFNSDSGISVSSSPEVDGRTDKAADTANPDSDSDSDAASGSDSGSDSERDEQEDERKDEQEDDDEDDDEDDEDDQEEESEGGDEAPRPCPTARSSSGTVTGGAHRFKALPDNDPLVQHLHDKEEEMRQHILHSPRPQRSLRNQVNSSFQPSSPLPLYDHQTPGVVPPGYQYPPPSAPSVPHGDAAFMYPQFSQTVHHHSPPDAPFGLDLKRTTIAGYELLASQLASRNLDEDKVRPVYRRFEHLNHRILLHLQDEIAEMEEELRILDESIAQMTPATKENVLQPASRRAEARFGSDLHFRRTEVLGRIFVKLGQYSEAPTNPTSSFFH